MKPRMQRRPCFRLSSQFYWSVPEIVGAVLLSFLLAYMAFIVIATDGEVLSELPEGGIDQAIGRAWSLIRRTK
jgi:hypothetical protein